MQNARVHGQYNDRHVEDGKMEMFRIDQFFCQKYKTNTSQKCGIDMLLRCFFQIHKCTEAYKQHQENVNKGLSGRQTVRIVESVPDKIQYIRGKTCKKDQKQSTVNCSFLHRNLFANHIQ